MITEQDNKRLTQVAKGTQMGELLRRYWHPVAAVSEFDNRRTTKPVRLLGEDLVLYRDLGGRYGLVERQCPHRRADLANGYVEECGLRCSYHGWLFDEKGNCLQQPFEEVIETSRFKDRIHIQSYPVQELAGLLFAYLGPAPIPLVPNWELFTLTNGFAQIVFSDVACNWLQCQENSIDPVHFEWLHANWSRVQAGIREPSPTHLKIHFEEFEYGLAYRRLLANEGEDSRSWQWPRLCILPNLFQPLSHFEWRVPVDEETTLTVVWQYTRIPSDREPYVQEKIPAWNAEIFDPTTGELTTSHVVNQDTVAWVGQGKISDRENEHLGRSDEGVRMLRRQLENDMAAIERGEHPKGLVFDPEDNRCIKLPGREILARRVTRDEWWENFRAFHRNLSGDYFSLLAGQPERVRAEFEEVMGISAKEVNELVAAI